VQINDDDDDDDVAVSCRRPIAVRLDADCYATLRYATLRLLYSGHVCYDRLDVT